MVGITIFKNLYDNKTNKSMTFEDWDSFTTFLENLSNKEYESKQDACLITPARFIDDTTRANKNVIDWYGWAAVDVDDHTFSGDLQQELANLYGKYTYVCYSTASSTTEHPKFRLVFPLSETVKNDKIKHFWFALNKELGDIGDPQTKDLSRMYFVPGRYKDSHSFFFINDGQCIDVPQLLSQHDYVEKVTGNSFLDNLPESVKKQIMNHRKEQMTNTNIRWSSYHDCPFINKQLVAEYKTISDTGWYRKMYQIMVSIASSAIRRKYPISANEIADMCTQIDNETGAWYKNRPLTREAQGAILFAYEHVDFSN